MLELRARLEPEILVKASARLLVRVEGLGLPTRAEEREHELRDEALAIRVLANEHSELADELFVPTARQLRLEAELESA